MGNNASCCHKETKNGAIEVVEAKAVDLQVFEASKESHTGTEARLSVPQQVRRRSEILKEGASLPGQKWDLFATQWQVDTPLAPIAKKAAVQFSEPQCCGWTLQSCEVGV